MRTAFSTDGAPTLSPTPRRAPSARSASQAARRVPPTAAAARRAAWCKRLGGRVLDVEMDGSVTQRLMCLPVESTSECKTRGEGAPWAARRERDAGRARRCLPWRRLGWAWTVAPRVRHVGDVVDVELVMSHAQATCMAIAIPCDEHDGGSPHRQHDLYAYR
jgi:hypothetical protein